MNQSSTDQTLATVLAAMNDLAKGPGGSYIVDKDIAAKIGQEVEEVRDYMDILEERGLTQSANSAGGYCAALTAKGRMTLKDPHFRVDNRVSDVVIQGNTGVFVNINSTLHSVSQSVTTSPHFQSNKEEVTKLVEQLKEALGNIPPENADEAEAIAETAKALVTNADKEKPNRALLNISADGLKQAARNLATVAPEVLKTSLELIKAVSS